MSDDKFKYGTEYTSVKIHQRPGGNTSICLGSQPEERRYPQPRKPVPVNQPEYPQYNQRSNYQPEYPQSNQRSNYQPEYPQSNQRSNYQPEYPQSNQRSNYQPEYSQSNQRSNYQPEYPQYNQRSNHQPPRAQEESKSDVHTSVKVKNPPGGRSTFSFY